jgi:hypothetical protein
MNKLILPGFSAVKGSNTKLFATVLVTAALDNIATQLLFFNFRFWAAKDKEFLVTISNLPTTLISTTTYPGITATVMANIPSAHSLVCLLQKQLENHFKINPKLLTYEYSYPIKIF